MCCKQQINLRKFNITAMLRDVFIKLLQLKRFIFIYTFVKFVIEKCQEEGGQTSVENHNMLKTSRRDDNARRRMKILGI